MEIRGIEPQPPQATFKCADCEQRPGEADTGGFFLYPVEDIESAIDREGWHVIDGGIVCDDCAYERADRVLELLDPQEEPVDA